MFTYVPIWTGPIDKMWVRENGFYWSAGRANVYENDSFTGRWIDIPLMASDDFHAFSTWLQNFTSDTEKTFESLHAAFSDDYGFTLEFYREFDEL